MSPNKHSRSFVRSLHCRVSHRQYHRSSAWVKKIDAAVNMLTMLSERTIAVEVDVCMCVRALVCTFVRVLLDTPVTKYARNATWSPRPLPVPRGSGTPEILSSTELLPLLWMPVTTTCGSGISFSRPNVLS